MAAPWNDEQIATLHRWYGREPVRITASRIGRPCNAVIGAARRYGLNAKSAHRGRRQRPRIITPHISATVAHFLEWRALRNG